MSTITAYLILEESDDRDPPIIIGGMLDKLEAERAVQQLRALYHDAAPHDPDWRAKYRMQSIPLVDTAGEIVQLVEWLLDARLTTKEHA